MRKVLTNRVVLNTLVLTIFTFTVEMLVRIFTGAPFNDFAVVRIFLSSLILGLIVADIGHFLPKLGQRILNIIYILFINIYEFAEFGLSSYIGFFMGVGNAEQGTKVGEFLRDYFDSFKLIHWTILIPILVFVLYYLVFDRKIMKKKTRNKEMNTLKKYILK